ncbi:MAG TPA: DNA mismatch repair endonuclease MutL [Methylomirabilota bacterium]
MSPQAEGRPSAAAVQRLPDAVVNKIAAGEVVERPASVVKELVENSLDAGATRIEISVRGAGRQLIAVTDDGRGMPPEDCLLALERHATSKLRTEGDLEAIGTLGFRGEALPAIFAVSRLSLLSRAADSARGFLVVGEGGVVAESGPADAPAGTAVEVRDLFFNTPARAKFLKSPATEQTAIVRVVTQLALANPGVHVRLVANGRILLNAPAGAGLRERIGALYGFGLASRLLAVSADSGGARLEGVVAPPAFARTHREDIHLIVNGRVVRDMLLTQALLEAFRPLLPRDQFPLAALGLEVDPSEVDVNVHPAKTWVRFRRPRALHGVVLDAVRAALRQMDAAPAGLAARLAGDEAGPGGAVFSAPGPGAGAGPPGWAADAAQASLFREGEAGYRGEPFFGRVVGQIEDTFIVAHTADEVFFVDQHVAHERVLFDRLRGELERGRLASQELLFPLPLELAPARLRALERVHAELGRLGFALEGFGGGAILLRAVPSLLRTEDLPRLADELSHEVDEDAGQGGSPVLDRLLAFVACRAAIKAHQALAPEEMAQVLTDLAETATPYYCPHGRPIVSRIPLGEIKRELRRTW